MVKPRRPEVNDVSILFDDSGANRCRRGLYRWAGGVGCEGISRPAKRERAARRGPVRGEHSPKQITQIIREEKA